MSGRRSSNTECDLQFEGCEVSDCHGTIWNAGERGGIEDVIMQWLEEDS
jgi:hypothetical protein